MARLGDNEFTYFIKIVDDTNEQYYLKSTIDEQNNTILIHLTNFKHSWVGVLNQDQVRVLAKKFPSETTDSFYSHTQRAFSKGHKAATTDGQTYVFNCKKLDKNRLEFIWKEKVEALNSLKIVGNVELQERPNDEVLSKMMDYTIDEIDTLRSGNEQKLNEIHRIDGQLTKALETVKRTVDIKEQLEADLYRKFVLVLNSKKNELAKLKQQLESYQNDQSTIDNGNEFYGDSQPIESPRNNKRNRDDISDDDDIQEIPVSTQPKLKTIDSSLDLGSDEKDYKPSTISKHYERKKHVTGVNSISTRPFVNQASMTSTTPSLPDDSQTTDDLLNKI